MFLVVMLCLAHKIPDRFFNLGGVPCGSLESRLAAASSSPAFSFLIIALTVVPSSMHRWIWTALHVSNVLAVLAALCLAWNLRTLFNRERAVRESPATTQQVTISPPAAAPPANDFVHALPRAIDTDGLFRFVSLLSSEQGVRLVDLKTESPTHSTTTSMGTVKCTLQLRGGYMEIKRILISVLAKYPGMTLEHVSLNRHDGPSGSPNAGGVEDASIELVQLLRPVSLQ